jgi:hypothetical protein
MKWKTLITSILIGTSTMATAASAQSWGWSWQWGQSQQDAYTRHHRPRAERNPYYNRDRDYPSNGQYDYNNGNRQWQPLVGPIANQNDRQFINLGADAGRFSALRMDVLSGRVFVKQIGVELMNGQTTGIQVNRWMSARDDSSRVIDLGDRRAVRRVVVYTAGDTHAAYQISGI